ncbi:MAG: hypothetical protein JWN75_1213 [Candidatus Saccharibacteria bacterium]|nr:hypothetical protein [Candidatus Saccharibacteria bacterium]MDB5716410.1 hypothetical protein [Sphingomonadales bacterium]
MSIALLLFVLAIIIHRRISLMPLTITPAQALSFLAVVQLRPFTANDWSGFAGCEDPNPLIGFFTHEDKNFTLVVDGAQLLICQDGDEGGGTQFQLEAL